MIYLFWGTIPGPCHERSFIFVFIPCKIGKIIRNVEGVRLQFIFCFITKTHPWKEPMGPVTEPSPVSHWICSIKIVVYSPYDTESKVVWQSCSGRSLNYTVWVYKSILLEVILFRGTGFRGPETLGHPIIFKTNMTHV